MTFLLTWMFTALLSVSFWTAIIVALARVIK